MCRLFAFTFTNDTPLDTKISFIDSFKYLSQTGSVLPTSTSGHTDGWGIIMYSQDGDVVNCHKSVNPAHLDTHFKSSLFFTENNFESGLAHLRKKTVGETSLKNTHPFTEGVYSFIHNGTVAEANAYQSLAHTCQGDTDSERLFKRFLEIKNNTQADTLQAFMMMIQEVRTMYPHYSALNSVLHEGKKIYASRSINVRSPRYSEEELLGYYTLYLGEIAHRGFVISSEKIDHPQVSYTLLPNHTICVIDLVGRTAETYQISL